MVYFSLIGDLHNQMDRSDFPKRFVEKSQRWLERDMLYRFVSHLELSGSTCTADGPFTLESPCGASFECGRRVRWGDVQVKIFIRLRTEGWAIVRETLPTLDEDGEPHYDSIIETACWVAPCSVNLPLPPTRGWKSADPLAHGNPRIQYMLEEEGSM